MSTRCYVGCAKTQRCIYVHFDGYTEAKLPTLSKMIVRDGAEKVVETLLSARTGGWSYLNEDQPEDGGTGLLGDRGRIVPGYGLAYTDVQTGEAEPTYIGDGLSEDDRIWIEYVYLIDPETGVITWFNTYGDTPTFHGVNPVEFLKETENV